MADKPRNKLTVPGLPEQVIDARRAMWGGWIDECMDAEADDYQRRIEAMLARIPGTRDI